MGCQNLETVGTRTSSETRCPVIQFQTDIKWSSTVVRNAADGTRSMSSASHEGSNSGFSVVLSVIEVLWYIPFSLNMSL